MVFLELDGYPLNVVQSDKVEVESLMNRHNTVLMPDKNNRAKYYFFDGGYSGEKIKLSVLVRDDDLAGEISLREYLYGLKKSFKPCTIVTEAVDVPNGDYILWSCKSTEEYPSESILSLEFLPWSEFDQVFTAGPQPVIGEGTTSTGADEVEGSTLTGILSGCTLSPGDSGECVEALQQALKNAGYYLYHEGVMLEVNGVYDDNTVFAVSLLQRDYRSDYNLTVNGLFDVQTRNCLINIQ